MSRIISLSDGTEVHFRDKFTHKADKAYSAALNEGAVQKEYTDTVDGKTTTVRERPVVNTDKAIEASLLIMIERTKKDNVESSPTIAWLDELPEDDYALLLSTIIDIRQSTREGKKNS